MEPKPLGSRAFYRSSVAAIDHHLFNAADRLGIICYDTSHYKNVRNVDRQSTCPVCNQPVESGSNKCACCGFMLIGVTQEIAAPGTGGIPSAGKRYHGKPTLTVTKGPLQDQVFDLDPLPVVIGRDPECDLFLNNMTVSRRHAIIEKDEGGSLILKDLESLNGTWVDGKVTDRAELTNGTLVQIGTFSMRFHS